MNCGITDVIVEEKQGDVIVVESGQPEAILLEPDTPGETILVQGSDCELVLLELSPVEGPTVIVQQTQTQPADLLVLTETDESVLVFDGTALIQELNVDVQADLMRSLIHLADGVGGPLDYFSGGYREIVGGVLPTSITWYEDATKVVKIVEKLLTYNVPGLSALPDTITWNAYAADGSTVLATVADTLTYAGALEISRTRVIT